MIGDARNTAGTTDSPKVLTYGTAVLIAHGRGSNSSISAMEPTLLVSLCSFRRRLYMSRPTALILDSTAHQAPLGRPVTPAPPIASASRLGDRIQDVWQTTVVVLYLIAAMTPQVRRVLMAVDKA